jgi:hypothetical protein
MIIWIASYPRSGNSLLRQILHSTMGLPSSPDAGQAPAAGELVLVKTHLPPVDDQPALYVVRDGRAAISSFLRFERHHSPESAPNSMLQLVLGDHFYGSWSDHYRAWHEDRSAPLLTLRYEELFDAGDDVLRRVASFVGYDGPVAPWENPIDEYRQRYPEVVGEGRVRWEPSEEWDWLCDAAFWSVHGELMRELGYDDGVRLPAPGPEAADIALHLVPLMSRWIADRHALQQECEEKEAVIRAQAEVIEELRVRELQR